MNMKILHFSDLHFKSNDTKILNLRDKIIDNINDEDSIDLIIFSGDLLDKPSAEEFDNAYKYFIKPITDKLNISIDNCFFTIGNHDVDLKKRKKVIFSGLKDQIIQKNDKESMTELITGDTALPEFEDYTSFINNLEQKSLMKNNNIYTIYKTKINNIEIGNISINTSLFMESSKTDFGNLYISSDLLLEISKEIKNCDIKILNLHHPLDWISNKKEIEKIMLDKFNLVFYGHEHNHDGIHISDLYNRDILTLSATSLYHSKNEKNGFCLYTYYSDSNELSFTKKEYNKYHNKFETISSEKIENINLLKKASNAIRNQHICSEIYPNLKNHINKYLAINLTSENSNKDIEDIYVNLKIIEEKKEKKEKKEDEKVFLLDDIIALNKNIILQGKQESGKTTLLNILNITCLKKYNNLIPIYISGNEFHNEYSIEVFTAKITDYFNRFYNKNKLNIKKMIEEKKVFIFNR